MLRSGVKLEFGGLALKGGMHQSPPVGPLPGPGHFGVQCPTCLRLVQLGYSVHTHGFLKSGNPGWGKGLGMMLYELCAERNIVVWGNYNIFPPPRQHLAYSKKQQLPNVLQI